MKSKDPKDLGKGIVSLGFDPDEMSSAEQSEMLETLGVDVNAGWSRLQKTLSATRPAAVSSPRRSALLEEIAALFALLSPQQRAGVLARKQLGEVSEHDLELIAKTLRNRAGKQP